MRKRIIVMVGSGGGGHVSTARALQEGVALAKKDYELEVMDVSEILGFAVSFGDNVYNWLLSSGRARWIPTWHAIGRLSSQLNNAQLVEVFRNALSKKKFDAIIMCIPFVNNLVAEAVSTMKPSPPVITILSDFDNSVDHPWMQDHRQHLICGTEAAVRQAEALGHPTDRVYGTSGMLVHPNFYGKMFEDKNEELRKLGLNPEWRTACILFGGFAPVFLPRVVNILTQLEEPLNLLIMCGKNKDIIEQAIIRPKTEEHNKIHTVGFTDQVAYYMQLSDFLIGKPGPGVVSEAIVSHLPVVIELNEEHTPPQERAVADWVVEKGAGVVIHDFDELPYAVERERLAVCAEKVKNISNKAVFEIPHIIEGILKLTERRHRRIASTSSNRSFLEDTPSPTSMSNSASVASMSQLAEGEASAAPKGDAASIHSLVQAIDALSVQSPSYLDYPEYFDEPLNLDYGMPERCILINASGRWGHDVIYYIIGKAAEPNTIEFHFSAGYNVTWFKELVVLDGNTVRGRVSTKDQDHGPKTLVFSPSDFNGSICLDFFKAGFLGIYAHAYRRFLAPQSCVGRSLHFLWARERFSSNLKGV